MVGGPRAWYSQAEMQAEPGTERVGMRNIPYKATKDGLQLRINTGADLGGLKSNNYIRLSLASAEGGMWMVPLPVKRGHCFGKLDEISQVPPGQVGGRKEVLLRFCRFSVTFFFVEQKMLGKSSRHGGGESDLPQI